MVSRRGAQTQPVTRDGQDQKWNHISETEISVQRNTLRRKQIHKKYAALRFWLRCCI